jgi:hypothetical protein
VFLSSDSSIIELVFDTAAEETPGPRLFEDGSSSARRPDVPRFTAAPRAAATSAAAQLREVLAVLAEVDPVDLPEAQALEDARELLAAQTQLQTVLLRRLGDIDTRKLHRLDASPTTTAWVRAQDGIVDASTLTLARRLSRLPGVEHAVRSGALSPRAGALIAAALTKLRPLVDRPDRLIDGQAGELAVTAVVVDGVRSAVCQSLGGLADDDTRVVELSAQLSEISCWPASQLARLEAAFVLLAEQIPSTGLNAAVALLVDALLPNELEKRAAKGADEAKLILRPNDDGSGWLLRGELDLETGELAHAVLTAMQAVDPDNPADTSATAALLDSGWEFGDPLPAGHALQPNPGTRPRSRGRRLHDALKLALRALLDSGELGVRDKVAPHIGVTIGIGALNREPGAAPAAGASGVPLPLSLIQTWWCNASVTRFVLGLGHRVLEASHTSRTLKPHERRIKHLESGGQCQGAGCCRGPGWTLIPHHVDPWAHCRTTSLRDTVLLCESDHVALHRGGTITLKDGRRLNADGWVR